MLDEPLRQLREAHEAHIDHQRLAGLGEFRPIEVHHVVLQVASDEPHGLRPIAVRQRDAGVGGATQPRRHAGNHLEVDAELAQGLDFLAAPPEDEGVAALQPHHPSPSLGAGQQHRVDFGLPDAVEGSPLADIDALGVAAAARQDGRRHQVVVIDDVRPLQCVQRLQREEVRITRSGAHEGDETLPRPRGGKPLQMCLGAGLVALRHQFGHRAVERLAPEVPPRLGIWQTRVEAGAVAADELRDAADGGRQQRLDALAQVRGEGRRGAAGGNGDRDGAPSHDAREHGRAERRVVHGVHQHGVGVAGIEHLSVHGALAGGGDDEPPPGHVLFAERALKHPYAAPRRQFPHRGVELGRHHHHIRAGFDERHDLARGDGAGTNDQARFAGELEEQWQRWLRRARCGRRVSVCAGHGPQAWRRHAASLPCPRKP